MIDDGVFRNWWADLCERFRMTGEDEPSQRQLKRYYRYLSERMDTDTFERAAEVVWAEREFFPKPSDFMDAAETPEGAALEQWELCHQIMQDSRRAHELLERMDAEGQRVVRMMGGVRQLTRTQLDEVQWRRKEFMRLYGTASVAAGREQIPPMSDDGKRIVEDAMAGRLEGS